jgi:hypothetical protein
MAPTARGGTVVPRGRDANDDNGTTETTRAPRTAAGAARARGGDE